jgi:Tol biopolymer transport system component
MPRSRLRRPRPTFVVLDSRGRHPRKVGKRYGGQCLTWRPDRKSFVFEGGVVQAVDEPGRPAQWFVKDSAIYQVDVRSGRVVRLAKSPRPPHVGYPEFPWPAYSPDGRKIAILRGSPGTGGTVSELHVANSDGSHDLRLIATRLRSALGLDWSPDGHRIAFAGSVYEPSQGHPEALYVVNADGSGLTQLTNDEFGAERPAWSPDGRQIAFVRNSVSVPPRSYRKLRIAVVNADGSDPRDLTSPVVNKRNDEAPAWQPLAR